MQMLKSWIAAAAVCLVVGGVGGAAVTYKLSDRAQVPGAEASAPAASAPALPAPSPTPVPSQSPEPAGGDIGAEGAKAFALAHAGVAAQQAAGVKVEQEWENGRLEYEVEFWDGTVEYDYTIDGVTGDVLKCQQENHVSQAPGSGDIGAENAKAAALAHAGLSAGAVTNMRVEGDRDDGRMEYEVEFWSGSVEYDYVIDGSDGTVLEYEKEDHGGTAAPAAPSSSLPANGDIGAEGAKAAALAHAGVAAQLATGMKVEPDWDDGRLEYEVEFWNGNTEYDYTIDGATGSVLEYKKEDRLPAAGGNGYIGEEVAGQAALAHAGIGTAAAQGYSCVVHHSDGVPHCYQVQFDCGDTHYEYEIGLYDGAVLHHGCSTYGHHQSSHHMGGHH